MNSYDLKECYEPINLTYRIHYKVINTPSPNDKRYDPIGKTILIETNLLKFDVVIPRTIQWTDIQLPENWLLEAASPPKPIENKKIKEILQYEDSDVVIKFDNNKNARFSTSFKPSSSHIPSTKIVFQRFYTHAPTIGSIITSSSKQNNLVFEGIVNSPRDILHGVYKNKIK